MTVRARSWIVLAAGIAMPTLLAWVMGVGPWPTISGWTTTTLARDVFQSPGAALISDGLRAVCLVLAAWAAIGLYRRGRRRTSFLTVVAGIGGFLTTQLIKAGVVPLPPYAPEDDGRGWWGPHDLSGHVAVAAAAVITTAAFGRDGSLSRTTHRLCRLAIALLAVASIGVVLAGWHDAGDVVLALGVAAAWCLAVRAGSELAGVTGVPDGRENRDSRFVLWGMSAGALFAAGWLVATLAVDAAGGQPVEPTTPPSTVGGALAVVATICVATSSVIGFSLVATKTSMALRKAEQTERSTGE